MGWSASRPSAPTAAVSTLVAPPRPAGADRHASNGVFRAGTHTLAEMSDNELVTQARRGDDIAFEELCARYQARVEARVGSRLSRKLRRKVSVADVMQESLMTASAQLGRFEHRGEGAFGAWLRGIADQKLRALRRKYVTTAKRDLRREVPCGESPQTRRIHARSPSPSSALIAEEQKSVVTAALSRLSPDHRLVLELLQMDGRSTTETAALMARSAEAVRKLYARALARMASLLERDMADTRDA